MSLFKPSMAVTRYTVSGIPMADETDMMSAILNALEVGRIQEVQDGEDVAWGWTSLLVPFEPKFNDMSFMTGDYITIGMRIDTKKVPAATLKHEVYLAEKAYKEAHQIPKLARAQKVMIKESVFKNLLAKAPVVPKNFDIIWNVSEQKIYLLSTNKMARMMLEDMIDQSFGLTIRMLFPFTMALESGIDEDTVASAEITSFI